MRAVLDTTHRGWSAVGDPCAGAARHWRLDPDVLYLNHGPFGACPIPVLEAQSVLRDRLQRQPVRFFLETMPELAAEARKALGSFVHADPDDLAFVPNASAAINTVLRSLTFERGDQILTTDHVYAACRNAARFVAERAGAELVQARV